MKAELFYELQVRPVIYTAQTFLLLVKFIGLNLVFGRPHLQLQHPPRTSDFSVLLGTHTTVDDCSLRRFGNYVLRRCTLLPSSG
jgi:hypothetical protein